MKQAKAAYQLNGKSTEALHVIARAALALKKDNEAEEAFSQALKLDPKSPAVRNDLAFFYLRRRRFEEARVLLESLIQDDPERTEFRLNLITALTHLDQTETARTYLSDLLTNHRTQITQDPLKGIANKVIHDLAEKFIGSQCSKSFNWIKHVPLAQTSPDDTFQRRHHAEHQASRLVGLCLLRNQ